MEEQGSQTTSEEALVRYLHSWGLREFHDEALYYSWQRSSLSAEKLQTLNGLLQDRQVDKSEQSDIDFYDLVAHPTILPVVYSQRFDYYLKMGALIARKIVPAQRVLDFGCGVGILTIFLAERYPHVEFVGMDRSAKSLETCQEAARNRQLKNVWVASPTKEFIQEVRPFDLILSSQVIFQQEKEPGLPSRDWRTFQRNLNQEDQDRMERLMGLDYRLTQLMGMLAPDGRIMFFEKTMHLGRRILFQRALEARGLKLVSEPVIVSYHTLGEPETEGPFYEVRKKPGEEPFFAWDESPFSTEGETVYRCRGSIASRMSETFSKTSQEREDAALSDSLGAWFFRHGIWEGTLVWGVIKGGHDYCGLIIGGIQDKEMLLGLFERLPKLTSPEMNAFIQDCWGAVGEGADDMDMPGYELHQPSAQRIFEGLPSKTVHQETTLQDGTGKEMHFELGESHKLIYFYWANTYDQRQLVLMDFAGLPMLRAYYEDAVHQIGASTSS